jgi:predicted Zn-dependent peptidase
MNKQKIHQQEFANGLVLIAEEMPWLESAAFSISVPAGCRFEPREKLGLANFVCEMVQRGCGHRNSREFVEELEWLGVDDSGSVTVYFTQFSGAMPAAGLSETLAIFADVLRKPLLPADQLEDGRMVCFQEVRSIEDDLSHKVIVELRKRFYGDPLGRWSPGTMESLSEIRLEDIQKYFAHTYRPNGMILSVAGKIDWPTTCKKVDELFGNWQPQDVAAAEESSSERGVHHIDFDSSQTQIGLAYESIPYSHPDYFRARSAVGVLSGGMSSRLFDEVREKRGLCYAVSATMHSVLDRGCVIGYAGTTAGRAQETLDVMLAEIEKLSDGITQEELDRVKVQIRSALVMQQESSRSRAASNAGDWFHLGRIRTRDEINDIIMNLTVDEINEYVAANRLNQFDLVTLGPQNLEIPSGVSTTTT